MPGTFAPGGQREVVALTASTTLTDFDIGKIFTNRGASGAITITLPAPSAANRGGAIEVYVVADQTVLVLSTGNVILFNDAAGNSVAFSTAGQLIGGCFRMVSDGTSWFAQALQAGSNAVTTAT